MRTLSLAGSIFLTLLLASLSALVAPTGQGPNSQQLQGSQLGQQAPAKAVDKLGYLAVERDASAHRAATSARATIPPMGEIIPGVEQ